MATETPSLTGNAHKAQVFTGGAEARRFMLARFGSGTAFTLVPAGTVGDGFMVFVTASKGFLGGFVRGSGWVVGKLTD
jgi:hypothetical protein